jgi:hypothetical protein
MPRFASVARSLTAGPLLLGLLLGTGSAQEGTPPAGTPAAGQAGQIEGLETFEVASNDHTDGTADYEQDPPAGGPHNPVWQDCGFYEEAVRNEHAVHSQEHGAVWVTYEPGLPEDDLRVLRRLADRADYLLVSPYPDLPAPIVASAWGAQLELESADDPRLRAFIREYAGQGPEPGAPCSGGTDETLPLPAGTPVATPAP